MDADLASGLERPPAASCHDKLLLVPAASGPEFLFSVRCIRAVASVVSLKFIEEQPQILRLTTPELKDVRGPVRSE